MASFDKGYALIIGIANYRRVSRLPDIVLNDARDISTLLKNPDRCGYPSDQVKSLLDEQATRHNILNGLEWLAQQVGQDNTVTVFFSGHGGRIEIDARQENYLFPVDTTP